MFFSSKKLIGLDVGSSSIKMAELDVSRTGATLQSFALFPTPMNSVSTGEITDIGQVGAVVQALVSDIKTKRKNVSVGLWGTSVIIKKITIPKMEKKLIKDQIRFEAEQYIPFDVTNISLDYFLLPKNSTPDTLDVLLIAAQNEVVNQYTNLVFSAGLKVQVIDVSGFALANAYEFNYGRSNSENIGLFNFGATVTNFTALSQGDVVFCRDIPVGGSNYSNEISKNMGISLQEAESLKISASSNREVPSEVHSVISSTSDAVGDEIRNSLDFLSAITNGLSLNRCYYTGGGSQTVGLIDHLKKTTGLPFEPINPFRRMKINSKKITPAFSQQINNYCSVALGLGLRQIGDHDQN